MLRLLIWTLLLANLGYFAWTQGALAALGWAPMVQAEPQRLKAQVKPEVLRLLNGPQGPESAAPAAAARPAPVAETPAPAPAPVAAPTACWQAGGYTPKQAESLRAALTASQLPPDTWQLANVESGGRWVVYMGRYNAEQMALKKAELRTMGVDFRELSVPALGPGLALGTFPTEAAAQQAQRDATRKGVRSARVAQERPETSSVRLRLPAATEAQHTAVAGLGAVLAGKSLQRCD